jgi:stearoyl-CoA desaturase (delta-9 desaturase)
VFWGGTELYRAEAKNAETIEKFGRGTPDDWMERNVYTRFSWEGVGLMLVVNVMLFGGAGLTIWAVQMAWIPVMAAGVINGFGHYWGYRNFACADASTNIVPWGILIGGEELHNNHHAYGTSAKLSSRWYEFDLGWTYIRILELLRLADVRKVAPKLRVESFAKSIPDSETLQAIIANRYAVATAYARTLKTTCAAELARLRERAGRSEFAHIPSVRRLKRWLSEDAVAKLHERERATLARAMEKSKALSTIYAMRQELNVLWERSTESSEQLLARLQDWCRRAEESGIAPLAQFSLQLKRYA